MYLYYLKLWTQQGKRNSFFVGVMAWCKHKDRTRCLIDGQERHLWVGQYWLHYLLGTLTDDVSDSSSATWHNVQVHWFPHHHHQSDLHLHLPYSPWCLFAALRNTQKMCVLTVFTCVPSLCAVNLFFWVWVSREPIYLHYIATPPPLYTCAAGFPHALLRSACSAALIPPGFLVQSKCALKPILE